MCLAAAYWARIDRIYFGNSAEDAARIGFDDSTIYTELARPHGMRTIPMIPLMREEAAAAFRAWEQSPNKILY
jgi:guanine deaminase